MGWAIFIIGSLLVIAGLIALLTAPKPTVKTSEAGRESVKDWAELFKQLNALLDKFDKRLRLGVLLIVLGVALIGVAGFVEAKKAKSDANGSALGPALSQGWA
jgi:uncharacterized membrane protein